MQNTVKWIAYSAIFFLFYALYGRLNGILELGYFSLGYNYAIYGFVGSFLVLLSFGVYKGSKLFSPLLLFTILGAFSCLINYSDDTSLVDNIICIISPISAFYIGVEISKMQIKDKEKVIRLLCIALFILEFFSVLAYSINSNPYLLDRDFVFCFLFLTPIVALIKNKKLGVILFIIAIVLIMISVKRSAILCIVVSGLLFFILALLFNKATSLKKKSLSIIVALPLTVGAVMYYLKTESADNVLERMESINSDGGSGRDVIYERVFERINNSDFFDLYFGHGYNAVSDEIFNHPAHNDLLEICYDFGFITLCAWLIVVVSILFSAIRALIHRTSYLGALYLSCFVLWQIASETNCIILNAPYCAAIFLIFGIISSDIKSERYKISKGTYSV